MEDPRPGLEINLSKIPVGDNVAGAMFAAGTAAIFLIGIPAIRPLFGLAVIGGCGVALALHFRPERKPPASCIPGARG